MSTDKGDDFRELVKHALLDPPTCSVVWKNARCFSEFTLKLDPSITLRCERLSGHDGPHHQVVYDHAAKTAREWRWE